MTWHDEVWPKQRTNVRRKRVSQAELDYRATVRRNKTRAATKASNARIAAERAERRKQRKANAETIARNAQTERLREPFDLEQLDNYCRLRYKAP